MNNPQNTQINDARLDGRARYAARKVGLKANKTRHGGFKIVNPNSNTIVADALSAEQVIQFCKGKNDAIADVT